MEYSFGDSSNSESRDDDDPFTDMEEEKEASAAQEPQGMYRRLSRLCPLRLAGAGHSDVHGLRDISQEAVWSLSTAKFGFGVAELLDNDVSTYWQSDGSHPHSVRMQFAKRTQFSSIKFYVDYMNDESYTPHRVSLRIGNAPADLRVRFCSCH
jgi:hypothetical protein